MGNMGTAWGQIAKHTGVRLENGHVGMTGHQEADVQ